MVTVADAHWNGLKVVAESCSEDNKRDRIIEALGSVSHISRVDEESHSRYYKYLTEHLCFPFTAHYPEPTTSLEEVQYRCTVLELLDPTRFLGFEFDGIFCKTCKGKFDVNLPLIELEVPDDSPNFQFIEDYWYWFWNWR
jgi:hypothetical protein